MGGVRVEDINRSYDEFTLNFTLSSKDTRTNLSQTEHEATNVVSFEEIAYSFTFKLVDAE